MAKQTRELLSSGPSLSFARIYDDHVDAIYRYAYHCLINPTEAEDLTAQTFYKALKSFWRFRWTGVPISAWLFRIATNEINNYFRDLAKAPTSGVLIEDGLPGQSCRIESLRDRTQVLKSLSHCLASLKPQDRTLIVLRFFERKTYAEIALITGKRISALKMRVHRALKHLQKDMEDRGVDDAFYRAAFAQSS